MMKPPPSPSFVVTQAEFLLQLLIITLNDPAMFGHVYQLDQRSVRRQSG